MQIGLGSDHGGLALKQHLSLWLGGQSHELTDFGCYSLDPVDYPDVAARLCVALQSDAIHRGVLICGTGQGMAIAANQFREVRAAVVSDVFSARMAMAHNDARVLCLGARVLGQGLAIECVKSWLEADFEGGRHSRRLRAVEKLRQSGR